MDIILEGTGLFGSYYESQICSLLAFCGTVIMFFLGLGMCGYLIKGT